MYIYMSLEYRDEEWLREKYVRKDWTMKEIAQHQNVSVQTISDWVHEHGLDDES
jgi:predicted DNA-binding protein YlxM (UPF0122 family)